MTEKKKVKHGGARPGAGRKSVRKLFSDLSLTKKRRQVMKYISDKDVELIVRNMVKRAKNDGTDAKYLLDQFIGKSLQATDVTSGGKKIESFNDEQVDRIAARIAKRRTSNGGA